MHPAPWRSYLFALLLVTIPNWLAAAPGEGSETTQETSGEFNVAVQQVLKVMDTWARSWSNLEPVGYISSYSPEYVANGFPSHFAWAASRQQRLQNTKKISLILKEVSIESGPADTIRVTFVQHYQSDSYKDVTKKRLDFSKVNGKWYIIKEVTLEVLG